MLLLKKIILGFSAFMLILWGGSGTQSQNVALQGGGFIALIVGLIILYIFGKMVWRAMGCLMSFLIIGGIIAFIIYAIGGFENGLLGMPQKIQSFLGQNKESSLEDTSLPQTISAGATTAVDSAPALAEKVAPSRKKNTPKKQQKKAFNPLDYPAIDVPVRVVNSDTLQIGGSYLKLYGIDGAEGNQTCANRQGRSYACGKQATAWLRDWISSYNVNCHIISQDQKGNMVGVCFLDQYDIAAALVNAGWALALPVPNNIYLMYEDQAKQNKRGLWQGEFYRPWDWRSLQGKKPKIKVMEPKKPQKEGMFGF